MNRLSDEQRRRNQLSQGNWPTYATHRRRVTDVLLEANRGAHPRLGILGAGNCNDVDLQQLLRWYGEIHLWDADADALAFGIHQQRVAASPRLQTHVRDELASFLDTQTDRQPLSRDAWAADLHRQLRQPVPRSAVCGLDVVASACALTQLIDTVASAVGADHSRVGELALDVRDRHLRSMWELLRPGGLGILITDFVSSDSCPELRDLPLADLPTVARQWIEAQNFFTGTNPFALRRRLMSTGSEAIRCERVEILRPWKWDFGPRVYAVSGVRFERARSASASSPPAHGMDRQ